MPSDIARPTSHELVMQWLYTMYTEGCVQSQGDRVGSFQARSRTAERQGCESGTTDSLGLTCTVLKVLRLIQPLFM